MKLLNFGALNIDVVYQVDHLVLPGETISSTSREINCGGKGLNQSVALARAGAQVFHAGMVGEDGGMLLELLGEAGADISLVREVPGGSGQAIIQVDRRGENSIILYGGANQRIDEPYIDEVISQFEEGDCIFLQNEISNLRYLMERAHEAGLRLIFNPSPFEKCLLSYPLDYVDYFVVNEVEGHQFSGKTEPEEILKTLMDRHQTAVLLTLGKEGALYGDDTGTVRHGIYQSEVVDTTGAGDTFTGFFFSALLSGQPPQDALRLASQASCITVSRPGAAPSIPTLAEVRERFHTER